ncbi:CsbD family protein [Erwinia persicina]|uniref:CsbD family protein n=1 Tax=Erwinia persicina TaxID=55211 RepID=UPI00177EBD3B|nr:CsbD family protein [Erwinia persicina]MBD8162929.1 CsbD family protein [Erwinia persicina]MBD8214334.1 CsbD family protein [Erwinia persicina]
MSLFDKANDKAQEAIGKGQEEFGKAVDSPEHEFRGKVRQQAAKASYAVDDALDCVKTKTQESPLVSLVIAAGVGFLAAKIFGRR